MTSVVENNSKMAARVFSSSEEDSHSEIDSESSFTQSDTDDPSPDQLAGVSAITGYQFEPRRRPTQGSNDGAERTQPVTVGRIGNTDWCTCGHCFAMQTETESLCCGEVDQIMAKFDEESEYTCITHHPGYIQGCINCYALDIAYLQYRQQYGGLPEGNDSNPARRYRYVAYRQVVRWCWGYLGRHNRVPLPSCVVNHIRETYPETGDGNYSGFRWTDMD